MILCSLRMQSFMTTKNKKAFSQHEFVSPNLKKIVIPSRKNSFVLEIEKFYYKI